MALKTITSKHRDPQRISICIGGGGRDAVVEDIGRQWVVLNHILVQLWELHAIHVKAIYGAERGTICEHIEGLLPEVMKGVRIEMVISQ